MYFNICCTPAVSYRSVFFTTIFVVYLFFSYCIYLLGLRSGVQTVKLLLYIMFVGDGRSYPCVHRVLPNVH